MFVSLLLPFKAATCFFVCCLDIDHREKGFVVRNSFLCLFHPDCNMKYKSNMKEMAWYSTKYRLKQLPCFRKLFSFSVRPKSIQFDCNMQYCNIQYFAILLRNKSNQYDVFQYSVISVNFYMFSCFLEVAGLGLQNMLRVLLTYQHGYQQMTNSIFSIQKKNIMNINIITGV